jgi:carboxylesterase
MRGQPTAVYTYFNQPRFASFDLEHPGDRRVGVMLVHGFTGTPLDMRPIADHLHAQGANCHAITLPGMATDIGRLAEVTAIGWRTAVLEAWEAHRARYRHAILVGYSMGGSAAIQMAAKSAPELLLLLAPFWRINDRRAPLLPVIKRVVREFKLLKDLDFTDPDQRRWIEAALPGVNMDDPEVQRMMREESGIPAAIIDEVRKFGGLARNDAPRVHAPTIVLQGTQDWVVNPRHTRQLIGAFSNLQGYHEFPGDHLITLDTVPSWPRVRELIDLDVVQAIR